MKVDADPRDEMLLGANVPDACVFDDATYEEGTETGNVELDPTGMKTGVFLEVGKLLPKDCGRDVDGASDNGNPLDDGALLLGDAPLELKAADVGSVETTGRVEEIDAEGPRLS